MAVIMVERIAGCSELAQAVDRRTSSISTGEGFAFLILYGAGRAMRVCHSNGKQRPSCGRPRLFSGKKLTNHSESLR